MSNRKSAKSLTQVAGDNRSKAKGRNLRRFLRNPLAVGGFLFILVLTLLSALAPYVTNWDPEEIDVRSIRKPPGGAHWLGTDTTGRDIFTRTVYGGRVSLLIGLAAVAISNTIGLLLGTSSGFYGGVVDFFVQRAVDILLAFPSTLFLLILVATLGRSPINLLIGLGFFGWPMACRLYRSQVLTVSTQDYILAARSLGAKNGRIITRHIMPNILHLALVNATLGIGGVIMAEASLSFLGLGVQPPIPSWGNLIGAANTLSGLRIYYWYWAPAAVALVGTCISLNLIGDAMNDIFNPRGTS